MALQNGVLVHGPRTWGAAVRLPDGTIKAASGPKPRLALGSIRSCAGRSFAEAFAVLPAMKRGLPEARLPFERPVVGVADRGVDGPTPLGDRRCRSSRARLPWSRLARPGAHRPSGRPDLVPRRSTSRSGRTRQVSAPEGARTLRVHLVGPLTLTTALAGAAAELVGTPPDGRALVGTVGAVERRSGLRLDVEEPRPKLARALAFLERLQRRLPGGRAMPSSRSPKPP